MVEKEESSFERPKEYSRMKTSKSVDGGVRLSFAPNKKIFYNFRAVLNCCLINNPRGIVGNRVCSPCAPLK